MIPLWAFTLGQEIFSSGEMVVPYSRIASSAVGMVVPLAIGCAIQHYWPSLSKVLVKILKPFSFTLILSIIIFATITNWYLFRLFTWQVIKTSWNLDFSRLSYKLAQNYNLNFITSFWGRFLLGTSNKHKGILNLWPSLS